MYPSTLEKLINCFRMLPSVGQKTAERYAMAVLEMDEEQIEQFATQLSEVTKKIKKCRICGNLTEGDVCDICASKDRDHKTICVVQTPKDVIALEKTGQYNGVYHVLHGAISTTKGVLPEDINIASLIDRVDDSIEEVILATNSTLEGDTTALYLTKVLKNKRDVNITRLASGIPSGGNLDYADNITLMRALQGRIKQ